MTSGRPPGPLPPDRLRRDDLEMARLQGESEGRTLGRMSERKLIVDWLRCQHGSPFQLAQRINEGDHVLK